MIKPAHLLATSIACCSSVHAECGQITLAFKATIAEIAGDGLDGLPFQVAEGVKVSGRLKIAKQQELKPSTLELEIDSVSLGSISVDISVSNDTFIDDGPVNGQAVDVIRAGCGVLDLPDCEPRQLVIAGSEPFAFRTRIELIGRESVLDSHEPPLSDGVWNQMDISRTLFLAFDLGGPGSMAADAIVSNFRVVPEPGSTTLICGMCFIAVICMPHSRILPY